MFVRRSAVALARQATHRAPIVSRTFSVSVSRNDAKHTAPAPVDTSKIKGLRDLKTEEDLIPQGAPVGTIPTDINQATGLERMEILGKMEGIDIWDMRPLDASRLGTMEDPIIVRTPGEEQYVGCTGSPADSHVVRWLTISRDRPIERCDECGNVIKMEYFGADHSHDDHGHGHDDHHAPNWEPKTFADYVKPDYFYK